MHDPGGRSIKGGGRPGRQSQIGSRLQYKKIAGPSRKYHVHCVKQDGARGRGPVKMDGDGRRMGRKMAERAGHRGKDAF